MPRSVSRSISIDTSTSLNTDASAAGSVQTGHYRGCYYHRVHLRDIIGSWLEIIVFAVYDFVYCCYDACRSFVQFLMGVTATALMSPIILVTVHRVGLSGLSIPVLLELSKVSFIGSRFLSFIISLRSPYSASINPCVEFYYLADSTDESPLVCEVEVSMPGGRYLYNASNRAHEAAIGNLADFACSLCVFSIMEKVENLPNLHAVPSGLYVDLLKEAKTGPYTTRMSFNMGEVVKELQRSPSQCLQQTLVCDVVDAKGRRIAQVGVKYSFDVGKRHSRRASKKGSRISSRMKET